LVFNIVHPRVFSWKEDFLPKLKAAGLDFETVEWSIWLEKLKGSEKDTEKNPTRKLLGFWGGDEVVKSDEKAHSHVNGEKVNGAAQANRGSVADNGSVEATGKEPESKEIRFETKETEKVCLNLRDAPRVVDGDMVRKLLDAWKASW